MKQFLARLFSHCSDACFTWIPWRQGKRASHRATCKVKMGYDSHGLGNFDANFDVRFGSRKAEKATSMYIFRMFHKDLRC